jgi:copper resistance protein B
MSTQGARVWLAAMMLFAGNAMSQEDHSQHQPADPDAEHRQHVPPRSDEDNAHADDRAAGEPTESERAHVPPDPPLLALGQMSNQRMIELMQMEDDAALGMIRVDELEAFRSDGENGVAWDVDAWYGTDYDKLWLKTKGDRLANETHARAELLWDRIVTQAWSVQAGVRHDVLEGPSRTWAALGLQGIAPHFFDIEATFYVRESGRTAARFSVERDMLITQRLMLQPQLEFNAYGKDDRENDIGSGISDLALGLRLRYEIIREIAPYVGVQWQRKLGDTADLTRAAGNDDSDVFIVAGVRAWF